MMQAEPTAPAQSIVVDWRATAGTAGIAAGTVLVVAGVLLPWVTTSGGVRSVNGLTGDGAYLIAAAVGGLSLWVAFLRNGGSLPLRGLIALCGVVIAYWASFDAWQIGRFVAATQQVVDGGPSTFGPGPLLALAGGVTVLVSALAAPPRTRALPREALLRVLLGGALLTSASIHLQLMPAHFAESPLLGTGFLLAALAQLALGAVVLVHPYKPAYLSVIGVSAALIVIYAYAVLHGLPIGSRDMEGVRVGAGEAVDLSGALSKAAELVGIVLASILLVRQRR